MRIFDIINLMKKKILNKISHKEIFDKSDNKKIVLLSNTSRYIFQYRLLLLKKLKLSYREIYIIAPFDKSSAVLKKYGKFINWKLLVTKNYSLINFIRSFTQLLYELKKTKPYIVHSHTLKGNLLVSIINFLFGINTIISFAGMGRLSNSQGLKKLLFRFILKIIYFLSIYKLENFTIRINKKRVKFIFQNPLDIKFFINCLNNSDINDLFYLIPGSGVPDKYLKSVKKISSKIDNDKKLEFIYCARLEKSKGIKLFINLSYFYPNSKFFVYGDLKGTSDDKLEKSQIEAHKKKNKNLLFMDYVEDPLLKHNNDFSILIVPSIYGEGLPRGILEALSLEIPVIAFKKSCVGLFDKNNLFIVKENNLKSYLKEIEKVKRHKENGTLTNFLRNGRKLVLKEYLESIIVKKTLKVYEEFKSK